MLNTQVQYWTLQENVRHNLETERQGQERLNIDWFSAQENQRHNIVSENISWDNLHETQRHNKVSEDIAWGNLQETNRHNVVTEGIQAEQARASLIQAESSKVQATASMLQANAAQRNASTNFMDFTVRKDTAKHQQNLMDAQAQNQKAGAYTQVYYGGEQLKQGWYNTAINAIGSISSIANTFGNMTRGTKNYLHY